MDLNCINLNFTQLHFITPIVVVFYYFIKYIPSNFRLCLGYSFRDRVFLVISFSVNSLLVCKHVTGFCVPIFFPKFYWVSVSYQIQSLDFSPDIILTHIKMDNLTSHSWIWRCFIFSSLIAAAKLLVTQEINHWK